jgi:hypothetical protein
MTVAEFRPRYETASNIEDEQKIASALSDAWRCELKKLPTSYLLDYAAVRDNRVHSWIEVKRRRRALNQFPTVFLSLQKVMAAIRLSEVSGVRCFFVIQFDDRLAYACMTKRRPIEFRGRTDRGDRQDQEAAVVIGVEEFKTIGALALVPA